MQQVARMSASDMRGKRGPGYRCAHPGYEKMDAYFVRFCSITSQIFAATSGPPSREMARMPVGEVTLISVR